MSTNTDEDDDLKAIWLRYLSYVNLITLSFLLDI